MKKRVLAMLLLLSLLLGMLGCEEQPVSDVTTDAETTEDAGDENTDEEEVTSEEEDSSSVSGDPSKEEEKEPEKGEEIPSLENVVNLAALDAREHPLYQIVYNIEEGEYAKEQCETLAKDIQKTTGVALPVLHSSESTKNQYEITVGTVARAETVDVINGIELKDGDFTVRTVGTRVLIYAKTQHALTSAIHFFMDELAEKHEKIAVYGIDEDTEFTYEHRKNGETAVVGLSEDETCFEFSLPTESRMNTHVRLSFTGNSAWRIQTKYRKGLDFEDTGASQLLAYTLGEHELGTTDRRFYREKLSVTKGNGTYTLTAPDQSSAVIDTKDASITFYTPKGAVANQIVKLEHNEKGSSVTGLLNEGEAVYGTGERFNGVNQRGKKIEMFTKDLWSRADACYIAIPLLCLSRGSGIFLNIYEHMFLSLGVPGSEDQWSAEITGAGIDCYVYTTEKIADVIDGYSKLSGYAEMPEEWTYGMIVCAYSPDLSEKWTADITPSSDGRGEGIYEMIANMEANDLPWTGVLAEAWGPYEAGKHRDLKELCDYVHSLGKKFLVYIRVGDVSGRMSGFTINYLLKQTLPSGALSYNLPDTTADTNNPDVGTAKKTHIYIDVTNPLAVEWFYGEYWDMLSNEIGVDGAKIDFCETLPENYELNYFDENVPTAGSHHWYPTAFCTMFWDMISQKPDSGMCYTRGGGIGSQRAPYMWAGDQIRYWPGLDYQVKAILSAGLSGLPFLSYDMSGYQYGNSKYMNIDYESEVFLRGTQFSAFTVCIQTHGKVRRAYQFESYEVTREIPKLDPTGEPMMDGDGNPITETVVVVPRGTYGYVTDIYRAYTKLHEHLTPYITALLEESCKTGMPVMRHLILGWQDDPTVHGIEDQFMMGDAFMIAPILTSANGGATVGRRVYLPELENGAQWKDLNTGILYDGGQWVEVRANIAQIPSFYNTGCKEALGLVDGIMELYDYAESMIP